MLWLTYLLKPAASVLQMSILGVMCASSGTSWFVDGSTGGVAVSDGMHVGDRFEDGSQLHPFDTIQEALDAAAAGDVIYLADGVYAGPGNVNLDFGGKDVTLRSRSGDRHRCVLDGGGRARLFRFHRGETRAAQVIDVTIRGGRAAGADGSAAATLGGAVYCANSSPMFRDCVFADNSALVRGGAVYCFGGGNAAFFRCWFGSNAAEVHSGGAIYAEQSALTMIDCELVNNVAGQDGGALALVDCAVEIIRTEISDNAAQDDGGGMWISGEAHGRVLDCVVAGNHAVEDDGGGIACLNGASPHFERCDISDNVAQDSAGGMFCIEGADVRLTDCTFTGNRAEGNYGGGFYCNTSRPILENCEFVGNYTLADGGGINCYEASPTLRNCRIMANYARDDGGALACNADCFPVVIGSVLRFNHAGDTGTEIYARNASAVTLVRTNVATGPGAVHLVHTATVQSGEPGGEAQLQ